jgi:hypothetical protein
MQESSLKAASNKSQKHLPARPKLVSTATTAMHTWSALTLLAAAAGLAPGAMASDEAKLRRLMADSRFLSIISCVAVVCGTVN